jgi:hypothetical protein
MTKAVAQGQSPGKLSFEWPTGTPFSDVDEANLALVYQPLHTHRLQGKLHLHFGNSKCHAARHVQEETASHRRVGVPHHPDSPDLAIADFYLPGRSKQQLSGRTLDSEQNVLETVSEVLSGQPKEEVESAFLHRKERCQWAADYNGEFHPN